MEQMEDVLVDAGHCVLRLLELEYRYGAVLRITLVTLQSLLF